MPQKFVQRQAVEAMRFRSFDDYLPILKWMKESGDTWAMANEIRYMTPVMLLQTSKGTVPVNEGDWVIKDQHDRFSVCRHDIFETLYANEWICIPEKK